MEVTTINWGEYNRYIELLQKNYELYEKKFKNNIFSLSLANGDYIELSFDRDNIPHLLGVNAENYRVAGIVRANTPADEIIEKLANGDISISSYKGSYRINVTNQFFSKKFMEKQKAFEYNVTIDTRKIFCIVKYDGEKTYQAEAVPEPCNYYIVRKENDNYYILGIKKAFTKYVPVTSRMYETEEEFKEFFSRIARKQEITYAYRLIIDNPSCNYHFTINLNSAEKQIALKRASYVAGKYDGVASVAKDFSYVLQGSQNNYQNNSNLKTLVGLVAEAVEKGTIIMEDDVKEVLGESEINCEELTDLINACNDKVTNQSSNVNEDNMRRYSEIQKDNNYYKSELTKCREQLEELKHKLEEAEETQNRLLEEKDSYVKKLGVFEEAIEKYNSIKNS